AGITRDHERETVRAAVAAGVVAGARRDRGAAGVGPAVGAAERAQDLGAQGIALVGVEHDDRTLPARGQAAELGDVALVPAGVAEAQTGVAATAHPAEADEVVGRRLAGQLRAQHLGDAVRRQAETRRPAGVRAHDVGAEARQIFGR